MAAAPVSVDDVPLLVVVLAGNPATAAAVLSCLKPVDTRALRQLHPAVAGTVAGIPWANTTTPVVDVVRWRAALPGAVGARLAERAVTGLLSSDAAVAALAGVTNLDLSGYDAVTDELIGCLPTSLRALDVCACYNLTPDASFAHLTALVSLGCSTEVDAAWIAGLPSSLQELTIGSISTTGFRSRLSLAHLSQLRVFRSGCSDMAVGTLVTLPPGLVELDLMACQNFAAAPALFRRLHGLQTLNVAASDAGDEVLACLPPSLVCLDAHSSGPTRAAVLPPLPALRQLDVSDTYAGDALMGSLPAGLEELRMVRCAGLTTGAKLGHVPALRLLDVSRTRVGDALVASLPAGLEELRMVRCGSVTDRATLDHVDALRALYSMGTALAPATVAACRARGCAVPASNVLYEHRRNVTALAMLGDGRLASGDGDGVVVLWNVAAAGSNTTAVLRVSSGVSAFAALPGGGGGRLAAGKGSSVMMGDVSGPPPVRTANFLCGSPVSALAVLSDGRLAVGCDDGRVRVVNVDANTAVATLEGHSQKVVALAVLLDGTLASGSWDDTVRVWDVGRAVWVATLGTCVVYCLAVLADGRLACGTSGGVVALWDVGSRTHVGTLPSGPVQVLAALPDGRLASESAGYTIQLWDTRPAAAAVVAATGRAAGTVPMTVLARVPERIVALALLPDGRLACSHTTDVFLLEVPPPATYE